VSRSSREDTVVLDEIEVEGAVSTGNARDVEFGERDEEEDVVVGC